MTGAPHHIVLFSILCENDIQYPHASYFTLGKKVVKHVHIWWCRSSVCRWRGALLLRPRPRPSSAGGYREVWGGEELVSELTVVHFMVGLGIPQKCSKMEVCSWASCLQMVFIWLRFWYVIWLPVVPHKAVAEVSQSETYRRGWLLWITDGRANPVLDWKVVGVVIVGVVAMVAVVTSPTTAGCSVWCSAAVAVT